MNTTSAQHIALRRNRMFVIKTADTLSPRATVAEVATFNRNLQVLGYVLAPNVLAALQLLTTAELTNVYNHTVEILKDIRGVKRMIAMYPNFPKQVIEASDAELYINAMIHYMTAALSDMTNGQVAIWLPKYAKQDRLPLDEKVELTVLQLAAPGMMNETATKIATANTSISDAQKEELRWLVANDFLKVPDSIPNKENLVTVAAMLFGKQDVSSLFKTATDVLRLAVGLSAGDVSLAANTKFRNFKRRERRELLSMLNACGSSLQEDMQRHQGPWMRLGEKLHPGEYTQFPKAAQAFKNIRSGELIPTFNAKVEKLIRANEITKASQLLGDRPGDFARRLDVLLRNSKTRTTSTVLDNFREVATKVSTPVLLQVAAHFQNRIEPSDLRVVFPKGNVGKARALDNNLPALSGAVAGEVIKICDDALSARFSELAPLGKVYIDPSLSEVLLPFSQRSASKSLRTLTRGSRVPIDVTGTEKDTVRFFIWWKENGSRADLDLSAVMYNDQWQMVEQITYYNLRGRGGVQAYHSGDITSAPNGACEFIDVNIPSVINNGGRYLIMTVNSFTSQPITELAECRAGWMMREKPQSGEVFEPSTIMDTADISTDAKALMPMIIDLVERKVIWMDAAYKSGSRSWGNNVNSNSDTIALLGKAFTQIKKPNIYNLLFLHATARGTIVDSPAEADVVYGPEMAYAGETLAAEFMQNALDKVKTA